VSLDARIRASRGRFTLDVEVACDAGSVLAVLGPNGAGKTTLLRCLGGNLAIDAGHVRLDGEVLDDPATGTFVAPEHRRVGTVPQDHLLFPHLSALENVAFGPRARGVARRDARERARARLAAVGLEDRAGDRPARLSGGQSQRVALARALATDPALLLLDEPLAALDATTRATTRRDLRRHLGDFPGPTVLVTHDPIDALVLADVIAVVEDGLVTQSGPAAEVARRPRTPYVADLVGTNLLRGEAHGTEVAVGAATVRLAETADGPVHLTIAPSAVTLHPDPPQGSARNRWPATVVDVEMVGERARVELTGELPLTAEVTPAAVADLGLAPGLAVWASVKATEVAAYP